MKLTIRCLRASASGVGEEPPFANLRDDFINIDEARALAKAVDIGADLFFITDAEDRELERWVRRGSTWEKAGA
jgi:hypothetical protein